jgi:hypothetical protein
MTNISSSRFLFVVVVNVDGIPFFSMLPTTLLFKLTSNQYVALLCEEIELEVTMIVAGFKSSFTSEDSFSFLLNSPIYNPPIYVVKPPRRILQGIDAAFTLGHKFV